MKRENEFCVGKDGDMLSLQVKRNRNLLPGAAGCKVNHDSEVSSVIKARGALSVHGTGEEFHQR